MKYNFEEIGKALVCFHIGRGGHFHNPGHKSYNPWVKSFGDLVNQDWLFINNEDEEGNELDDDDWTLTDCSGNVLIEGRDEIEAETGTLSRDGEYDTDIVQRLEDCDDDEIELVYEEGTHHSLMDDDLLAYCCWRLDKKMIDTVDFDAPRACTVNFTDGTNGTITFTEGQDINDTIDDFFVENDIDDKSRDKWFDKIECEYDDCLERFTLYRDDNDLRDGWKCTDQENGIVCRFKIHRFNETQQFEFNTDVDPDAAVIAKALREMGDWLSANHKEIVF